MKTTAKDEVRAHVFIVALIHGAQHSAESD